MNWVDHGSGMAGFGMLLFWLIPLVLIGWFFALMLAGKSKFRRSSSSPQEALDERYALGEIDRDEYLTRRRDLGIEDKA